VYVAHYGPSGDHVWSYNFANSAAPSNSFAPIGIAADASGHAVVAVAANGSLRLNGSTLLPCGTSSLALFRLAASNGAFMSGACHGQDITGATDMLLAANGDIIVVGSFTDSVDLGGGTIASAGTHAFIARYDGATLAYESGAVLGGGAMRSVRRIARSAGGDFVLSGSCVGVADFGGGVVSANPQGDGTSEDFCVVKLSSTLSPQWVFQRGDNGADLAQAADFLPNGEVVVMGRFLQLVDFGEGFLHNGGTGRVVMLRLSGASGALADPVLGQSVQVLGPECDAPVEIVGLTTSASGDFHVTGQATGCSGADLGAGPIGYFVTRFSSFGVHASTLGTNAGFVGFDLARSPSGLIAFSGHTQLGNNSPTDTFGLGPIGGYGEPFVVRWVP
jgi:hypothetical protein